MPTTVPVIVVPWAASLETLAAELTCEMVNAETQKSSQMKTKSFLFISPPQNEKRSLETIQQTSDFDRAGNPIRAVKGSNKVSVSCAKVCSQPSLELKNL